MAAKREKCRLLSFLFFPLPHPPTHTDDVFKAKTFPRGKSDGKFIEPQTFLLAFMRKFLMSFWICYRLVLLDMRAQTIALSALKLVFTVSESIRNCRCRRKIFTTQVIIGNFSAMSGDNFAFSTYTIRSFCRRHHKRSDSLTTHTFDFVTNRYHSKRVTNR
jgi:hypothetical protein